MSVESYQYCPETGKLLILYSELFNERRRATASVAVSVCHDKSFQ